MQFNPDIKGIICGNDTMAGGAAPSLKWLSNRLTLISIGKDEKQLVNCIITKDNVGKLKNFVCTP